MIKILLSIHSKVQDFGDEDEKNCETDEMNKDMNESCIFIADQKSENTKHTTRYKQTLCKFCRKKNKRRDVKEVLFHVKTSVKKKTSVQT